jgi:hypothetical protein
MLCANQHGWSCTQQGVEREAYRAPTALYRTASPSMASLEGPTLGVAILPAMLWRLLSAMLAARALSVVDSGRCAASQRATLARDPSPGAAVMQAKKRGTGACKGATGRGQRGTRRRLGCRWVGGGRTCARSVRSHEMLGCRPAVSPRVASRAAVSAGRSLLLASRPCSLLCVRFDAFCPELCHGQPKCRPRRVRQRPQRTHCELGRGRLAPPNPGWRSRRWGRPRGPPSPDFTKKDSHTAARGIRLPSNTATRWRDGHSTPPCTCARQGIYLHCLHILSPYLSQTPLTVSSATAISHNLFKQRRKGSMLHTRADNGNPHPLTMVALIH